MSIKGTIARKAGGVAADRLLDELSDRLTGVTRTAIEQVVRTRGPAIAADVDVFRLRHPDLTGPALDRALVRARSRRTGQAGFVTGLPGVVPAVGTAVEIGAAVADAAAVTYAQVSMILALSHLHGRDIRDLPARRLDVLLALGIDAEVVERDGDVLKADGHSIDLAALRRQGLPDDVVASLNRTLGERVVRRIADRRARSFVGRLLPFGLGVMVAVSSDYRAAASVGKAAQTYLDWLESDTVSLPTVTR